MPIPEMYSEAMLGTFRNMAQECRDKGSSGPDFDNMIAVLDRMEQLAEELDDFNKYSAILLQEGLQMKFSQHYGRVLSSEAKAKVEEEGYDDATLLNRTVQAYEDAIPRMLEAEKQAFAEAKGDLSKIKVSIKMVPLLQEIVDFGRSGVSLPVFLIELIKRGWEKALQGQLAVRDSILYQIELSEALDIPPVINKNKNSLAKFDELASKASFGIPDSFEFQLANREIDWKWEPVIIKWRAIERRIDRIFDILADWIDSYCKFAPYDDRWASLQGMSITKKNIRRTNGCNPGFLRERLRILNENFGISWEGIFEHEVYKFWRSRNYFSYSNEYFQLLLDTYPHCTIEDGKVKEPPKELIQLSEQLHEEKRCMNPNIERHRQHMIAVYDRYWGEGAYNKNFGN